MHAAQLGLLFATISAFFNGSFGAFTKLRKARLVPPLVMNFWMAQGVALSSLALVAVPPRVFSLWGLLSGALFVASAAHAVTAISLIGITAATGVWCGTAVVVSFAWGVLVAGDNVARMGGAVAALALILCAIVGIALAAWAGGSRPEAEGSDDEGVEGMGESLLEGGEATMAGWLVVEQTWQQKLGPGARTLLGVMAAVVAGVFGGLILAPMVAAPKRVQGIQFVPSMGLGALLAAPLSMLALTTTQQVTFIQATSSRAAGPGMLAGATWNVGNVCSIAAVTNPHIGMAVAMPIMQCGLFVAGIWGILVFAEVSGRRALAAYWLSGAALVAGAALLAHAKES